MDPDAFVYCQKKGRLVKKKIRKLRRGDMIIAVSKDWDVRLVMVNTVIERVLPSSIVSKYTFKNGETLIATDYQRLTRLYDAPYNSDEPLNSGTYMTYRCDDGNQQIGMTEISFVEGLDYPQTILVRLYALNCVDISVNNLTNGIIVNGVPVNSFNLS